MEKLSPRASAPALAPRFDSHLDPERILRLCVQACAASLILLGVLVLIGWSLDIGALMSILPGYVSMKPNTASGFLASGAALLLATSRRAGVLLWSSLAAAVTLLLGALSLAEYLLHADLHIDQLLFRDTMQTIDPGRMAYITAVAFCIGGLALLLMHGALFVRRLSQALALLLATLSLASIVGYLYGVSALYGSFNNANSMALHTGVGFLILGCGLVLVRHDSTIGRLLCARERGGNLARRLLPLLVGLPILLGYLYLRPAVNLGQLRFGMALFAVTLSLAGSLAMVIVGRSLNRAERQQREMMQVAAEAAAAIELSERELRLVTDHLPALIAYIDASEQFVRVNRTYEQWLGRAPEQIVGHTLREVLGAPYADRTRHIRKAARRGQTSSTETPHPTLRGERAALITYVPDLDEKGRFRGFVCMVMDVEDQRRAEAALRQNEKLAAVGRLSSSIAHEINNPVDAAMNLLYLAREQTADAEIRSLLEIADSELKRVANIAGETLRFHKQADRPERVLAADLFASVLMLHSRRLRNNRIEVLRRERALKPFECFEGEIRQVLNNLIANAIDAMLPGGRLLLRSRPAVDWASGQHGIALTIADTGSGMNEQTRNRIFEAFFTTKGIGGTGLGLWISSEILIRHGGHLKLRSSTLDRRHGTVFVIFLPLNSPLSEDVPISEPLYIFGNH
ncbi:PAS domain S-box-containing protein [Granulicella rosea]|uniref:histidine kinase n=1 Tax=Granulicella rosea TaxID=474952 RepID=A0A239HDW0_9BACT|nr:PAS domain-containing sensor histidine kinase [Granulicella rosea]SNS79626.1 PAS domain S-box-containing protein [Granulicella rosea]